MQKEKMFGVLVFLVLLGWLNNVVFCVIQIIVYFSVMQMNAGGLCHGTSVFFSQLTI